MSIVGELFAFDLTPVDALIVIAIGYFLGSLPFGYLITRMAGLGDIRKMGSGNIGATNVLRTGKRHLAALTLLLDALKATFAVIICAKLYGTDAGLIAGAAAFIGHLFPVWLGFKGGKGVATYIGVLLGIAPAAVLIFAFVWLLVARLSRYSSLSALVATLVIPVALWIMDQPQASLVMAVLTIISWWRHKANIERLISGKESRIGDKG
ncbi:glycerol-3-phosphate 1-O-acyltransferase PlsY [Martelella lutilitoris]|uniref:Glycerol-3-phosphate acyltransferase n=1 Tax=Martelella lutilitoris TaxID=2583532 RepID=A0A7T7KKE2_9HYPH|nr:glycerol-3-phosphate 1-O-acyltransferase PlsY [Martelella lutilitoris]QQM29597.1 glycerol-3-phosphate 1-O-acyltransferase PlsY [Martelella lutilitoris]